MLLPGLLKSHQSLKLVSIITVLLASFLSLSGDRRVEYGNIGEDLLIAEADRFGISIIQFEAGEIRAASRTNGVTLRCCRMQLGSGGDKWQDGLG